jgi:hypothetical protein
MNRLVSPLVALLVGTPVFADDSVIIGRGISNSFQFKVDCPADWLCVDAQYLWVLSADRTVVGPPIEGKVRAIAIQHVDATQTYVNSVELFVLSRISGPSPSGADFWIVALSPRYPDGRYCLSVDPSAIGLRLDPAKVSAHDGSYCFDARLL